MASQSSQQARMTILLCIFGALCEGIDMQAAGVAAAGIARQFHPSPGQLGIFFSASTAGMFIGALVGGHAADTVGRKTVLLGSIILFGLFSLLTPLASDIHSLTWFRLLTGLGLGGSFPMLITLVAEGSSKGRQNANVALVYAGAPLGGGLISVAAAAIAPEHWRWLFTMGGVLPLALAPVIALWMDESQTFKTARAGSDALSAGSREIPVPKAGSLLAVLREGRATRTLLLWSSFFLGLSILFLMLNWLPTLLVFHGFSSSQAGGMLIAFNLGGAMSALLIGRILDGSLRNVSIVIVFVILPALFTALATINSGVIATAILVFMLGCALLASQTFLYAAAPACYPTLIRGVGVGAAVAVGRIGAIAGPALGGLLQAKGAGFQQLLIELLPIVVVSSISAIILAFRKGP
jgi:MFS transporter, AAHS family, 3-hydroxyphenylpropionic acid transporter